jgi:hypothetical protein
MPRDHIDLDICERVKKLGYAPSQRVMLYGREYEILSDPFLEEGKIVVRARTNKNPVVHTLRLPHTVLQSALRQTVKKAA